MKYPQGRDISFFIRLFVSIFALVFSSVIYAQQTCSIDDKWTKTTLDEDHLLIAVMRVNNRPLVESIDVYKQQENYFIPLSQLGFLFDLPWHFQESNKRFFSKFTSDSNPALCQFDLNFENSDASSSNFWAEDSYDTYIDAKIIATLLAGEVSFNEELQQLNFSSADTSLGLDANNSTQVDTYYNKVDVGHFPIVKDKYQIFTSPLVNYGLNKTLTDSNSSIRWRANLNAHFDLLNLASEYRLISNPNRSSHFLKFSKNIAHSQSQTIELGNIRTINDRASKYEFGDITYLGDELIFPTKQVLGVNLFSFSQNQRRNFSNIQIEETTLPGWRGVLFRNGEFIDEQDVDENNRIVFQNVATFIGVNNFVIRLFGPQGQEEIRRQVVQVGQNQRQSKQFDYRVSATDAGRSLFEKNSTKSGFDRQVTLAGIYGINENLSAELAIHELLNHTVQASQRAPDQILPYRFISTSADYSGFQSLIRAKYVQSIYEHRDKGEAFFLGINSQLSDTFNANISFKHLNDFQSERHTKRQGLEQELTARINGRIRAPFNLGLGFNFSDQQFVDAARKRALSVTSSQNILGSTISNTLLYNEQGQEKRLSHRLFSSAQLGKWHVSQSLTWEPFNKAQISQYTANVRWPQRKRIFNQTSLNYRKSSNNINKLSLSHQFAWRAERFNFQAGASIDNTGGWSIRLGITGSIFHDRKSNSFKLDRVKSNTARRIEAQAFIDRDRNGQFSEGDEMATDIKFEGVANWREHQTDESGRVQLFTASDYQSISVNEESLGDPFLSANEATKIVASHSGGVSKVVFALQPVNDIEGYVVTTKNDKEKGLLGLTLRLRDKNSEQYWETKTQSDGYYYFTQIPPGEYSIEVDSGQLTQLALIQTEQIRLIAPKDGDIVSIDTIVLKPSEFASLPENIPIHQFE